MNDEYHFCAFQVGGRLFGVPVGRVQEVIRHQTMTRVPLASPEIGGLINLRGQIITTIDLRRRLKMPERGHDAKPTNVLISTPEGAVSFQVDRIEDVIEVAPDSIESPPETLQGELRRCIRGVSKLDGRLLLILDEHRAMELAS